MEFLVLVETAIKSIEKAAEMMKHELTVFISQYSSQVTLRVHALRGMRAREKLARAQGALEELRAKPKPLES